MSQRLFGTDGVRGIANRELTPDLAFRLAFSAAHTLFEDRGERRTALIGHDTRISTDMLEAALVAGFTAAGVDVYLAGTIPTPGIAWLSRDYDCELGVVISASHNSYEHNGIKIFNHEGYKLPDEVEDKIAANLHIYEEIKQRPIADNIGRVKRLVDAEDAYREHLRNLVSLDLTGLKLVLDTANGASYHIAPRLFQDLGADLVILANDPDGTNINENCGSTHVENLCGRVLAEKADAGFAFDGDADRLMAVDEKGHIMDGDIMLSILAKDMQRSGRLNQDTLVLTVMSNIGVDLMAERENLHLSKTKVGDRYVLEEMLKRGYNLGGEQSGHMIFLDDSTTGDGMLSALKLLEARQNSGKSFSQLAEIVELYPQVLVNVEVANSLKDKVLEDEDIKAACARISEQLAGEGRILLRASGTEPKIRIMLEGKNHDEIQDLADSVARLVASRFTY